MSVYKNEEYRAGFKNGVYLAKLYLLGILGKEKARQILNDEELFNNHILPLDYAKPIIILEAKDIIQDAVKKMMLELEGK
jgi:hypothetical protein